MRTILRLMCLAILMMGTCQNINAQTRRTPVRKTNTAQKKIVPKSKIGAAKNTKPEKVVAVNMGYTMNWANVDIDGNSETCGPLLALHENGKDVATQKLGKGWHRPTCEEYYQLFTNCDIDAVLSKGKPTKLVLTSRINGASITFCIPKGTIYEDKYIKNPIGRNFYRYFFDESYIVLTPLSSAGKNEIKSICRKYGARPSVKTWSDEFKLRILQALNVAMPTEQGERTEIEGFSNNLEYMIVYHDNFYNEDNSGLKIPIRAVFDAPSDDN